MRDGPLGVVLPRERRGDVEVSIATRLGRLPPQQVTTGYGHRPILSAGGGVSTADSEAAWSCWNWQVTGEMR